MTTAANTPAAAEEAIAKILFEQGLSQRAIEKAIRKIRNLLSRVPTRAHARSGADTDNKITNTTVDFDEDGRLLDLYTPTPPAWVVTIIKSALKLRGIAENRWAEAWHFFRSWNLDKPSQSPRIAVRALKAWMKKCKLRNTKLELKPGADTGKPTDSTPCPEGLNPKIWNYCVEKSGRLSQAARQKLGQEYAVRLRELMSKGMSATDAMHQAHYTAIHAGEIE